MMSEKEKRKHGVAAKPRYVVLKVLAVLGLVYVLGILGYLLSIYPLQILPTLVSGLLWILSAAISYNMVVWICGSVFLVFVFACVERGFYRWRRVSYVIVTMLLATLIMVISYFTAWFGYAHNASISLHNRTYHVASQFDGDIGADYYFFICDSIGITCMEKKQFGNYVDLSDIQLRISDDGKAVEVITTNYDSTIGVLYTYTPETAGTE